MQGFECLGDVVVWFKVVDACGSGVHNPLQRCKCLCWKAGQHVITVVQLRLDTKLLVTSCPSWLRTARSRRSWQKHALVIRMMCDFIVSSESKKSPRSRTTVDGDTQSGLTWRCWSADESSPRFVAEPNHMTSVLLVLSRRRFSAHQLLTTDTQTSSLVATSLTRNGLPRPVPCMSSANK